MTDINVLLEELKRIGKSRLPNHTEDEGFKGEPSVYLRTNLMTDHKGFINYSNKVTEDLLSQISATNSKRKKDDIDNYHKVVMKVLLNLYANYNLFTELKLRTPSKNNKEYIGLSDDAMSKIYNALDAFGYVRITAEGSECINRVRRRIATDKLITEIKQTGIKFDDIYAESTKRIIFRKDKKVSNKLIEDMEDVDSSIEASKAMLGRLNKINKVLQSSKIFLCLPDSVFNEKFSADEDYIDYYKKYYHRVFNNSSRREGGRFYGVWWQQIKKELRSYITINGKRTVELDFKAIQPSILYAQKGQPLKEGEDPYNIDLTKYNLPNPESHDYKEDIRPVVKEAFNLMLNHTEGKMSTGGKYTKMIDEYKGKIGWGCLLDEIKNRHHVISEDFNSGVGIKLQYKDSQIAEKVLLYFTKKGIACLCMHDSFIVEHQYENELRDVMNKSYKDVIKHSCLGIDIKDKSNITTIYDNMPNNYCLDEILSKSDKVIFKYKKYIDLNS